jgi:hypothetical protein
MKALMLVTTLAALSFATLPALGQSPTLAERVESLGRMSSATSPTLSPDGNSIAYLTQSRSVSGTQLIFGVIDSFAAHRDGYYPLCSCTNRTARSRTSGGQQQ